MRVSPGTTTPQALARSRSLRGARSTALAVPLLALAALCASACGSGPSAAADLENAPDVPSQSAVDASHPKTLDDLTPAVINQFLQDLDDYIPLKNDSDRLPQAAALRQRIALKAKVYHQAMVEALQDGDQTQKRLAAFTLGFLNEPAMAPRTIAHLLGVLEDGDADLTFFALAGLVEVGTFELRRYPERDRLLYPLVQYLEADDKRVRARAAEVIGLALIGDPIEKRDVLDALMLRLTEEPDAGVRGWIVGALGACGNSQALDQVRSAAFEDRNADVRIDAVIELGRSQHPRFIDALLTTLGDPSAAVRLETIGQFDKHRALGDRRAEVAHAIVALLRDTNGSVRARAALALGMLGETSVVSDLIAKLSDRLVKVQIAAIRALGLLRDSRAIRPLIGALADRNTEVKDGAFASLVVITKIDAFGKDVVLWQQWFDAGMPPVSQRSSSNTSATNSTTPAVPGATGQPATAPSH